MLTVVLSGLFFLLSFTARGAETPGQSAEPTLVDDPIVDYRNDKMKEQPKSELLSVCYDLNGNGIQEILLSAPQEWKASGGEWTVYCQEEERWRKLEDTISFNDKDAWIGEYPGVEGRVIVAYTQNGSDAGILRAYRMKERRIETIALESPPSGSPRERIEKMMQGMTSLPTEVLAFNADRYNVHFEEQVWRIFCDLDGDGHDEALVSLPPRTWGTAGGLWTVYVKRNGRWRQLEETITLHDKAAWLGEYPGIKGRALVCFIHCSSTYGALVAYQLEEGKIRETVIDPHFEWEGKDGEDRLEKAMEGKAPVEAELTLEPLLAKPVAKK